MQMFTENRKSLPPGYTGHLPYKNDTIGMTIGEANKLSIATYELNNNSNPFGLTAQMMISNRNSSFVNQGQSSPNNQSFVNEHDISSFIQEQNLDPADYYKSQKMLSIGNKSRNATTWIGGPKHEIRTQMIPGYSGFQPGIYSENLFAKSFSKCSASSLNNKIQRGHDLSPEKRYVTINAKAFNDKNFRRIVEDKEMASKRDYLEYTVTLNAQENERRKRFLDTSMGSIIPESTRGRNQSYIDPTNTTLSPIKGRMPSTNSLMGIRQREIQVKPILLEKQIVDRAEFANLGEGFKRIFAQDDDIDQKNIVIPIAGYTGHRKGYKVENLFGKSFREITIQSKRIEREHSQSKSQFIKS